MVSEKQHDQKRPLSLQLFVSRKMEIGELRGKAKKNEEIKKAESEEK